MLEGADLKFTDGDTAHAPSIHPGQALPSSPPHMDLLFLPKPAFDACSFIHLFIQHPYVEQPLGAKEQGGRTELIHEI